MPNKPHTPQTLNVLQSRLTRLEHVVNSLRTVVEGMRVNSLDAVPAQYERKMKDGLPAVEQFVNSVWAEYFEVQEDRSQPDDPSGK